MNGIFDAVSMSFLMQSSAIFITSSQIAPDCNCRHCEVDKQKVNDFTPNFEPPHKSPFQASFSVLFPTVYRWFDTQDKGLTLFALFALLPIIGERVETGSAGTQNTIQTNRGALTEVS